MKTIVVGYDASDAAERALDRAAELAEALAARIVVVSVSTAAAPAPVLEPTGPMLVPGGATGPVFTGGTTPLAEPEPIPRKSRSICSSGHGRGSQREVSTRTTSRRSGHPPRGCSPSRTSATPS